MTEEQIIDFLNENIDYFVTNDLVLAVFRTIGWWLVNGLNAILDFCSSLYDKTFALIDITSWPVVDDFIEDYDPLIKAIMVLSLVILGYIYIIGKNKQNDLLVSVLIFTVVITSSNYLFSTFNSFAMMFKDAVVGEDGTVDGYALVNQNLYDLIYIDEQIGLDEMEEGAQLPQYGDLTEKEMKMINVTEIIADDEEDLTDNAKDILGKRLMFREGGSKLEDAYNGLLWTDAMNTYYYRYKFNYGTYYLAAITAIIVFLGLAYKNVRIVWELLTSRILAALFSADLSSKKKIVKILEGIRDGYYALCFTAITLRVYFLVTDYVTDQIRDNAIARGFILLFVAFCAIDGANIMERITGVDAGLSSITGKLLAGMHIVGGAVRTVQAARQFRMMKKQTEAMQKQAESMQRQGESLERMEGGNIGTDGTEQDAQQPRSDSGETTGFSEHDMEENQKATEGAGEPGYTNNAGSKNDMPGNDSNKSFDEDSKGQEDKFRTMDEEISGSETGERQPNLNNGNIKYNRDGEGMFDKWAEKPSAQSSNKSMDKERIFDRQDGNNKKEK